MRKRLKEIVKIFDRLEVEIDDIKQTVGHYKIYAKKGTHTRMFVAANTPSDYRGGLNFTSEVKKWLRSFI